MEHKIPHATMLENLEFSCLYSVPALVRGAFITRPAMARWLTRLDTQARAQRLCMKLRVRYGGRSIYVKGPTGKVLLVLSQGDVKQVLTSPDSVFSLCTTDKRRGLASIQPDSLLLSEGELRQDRRRFHDAVLQPGRLPHDLAPRVRQVMAEELDGVFGHRPGAVDWGRLRDGYDRALLRLVFGDAARDDSEILAAHRALRHEANWMGLRKWRAREVRVHRHTLLGGIERHVRAAAPDSLVGLFATAPQTAATCPAGQVPHWLMALDAIGGVAIIPALALLAGHPGHAARARDPESGLDHLGACLCEALRLWPLVPTLVRTVTTPTTWHGTRLPAGTDIMIPLTVHHRNPQIEYANSFTPEAWLDGRAQADWWIVPFSDGPGRCPGAELGIHVGASALATLLNQYDFRPIGPGLQPGRPLPKTLDPLSLRLHVQPLGITSPITG